MNGPRCLKEKPLDSGSAVRQLTTLLFYDKMCQLTSSLPDGAFCIHGLSKRKAADTPKNASG